MASRPIWRGHLRLALVSCPVAMFNARSERSSIHFNLINPDTGNRIKMVTKDSETGDELQRSALVKGYEYSKGRYLILSDEDLDSVKVESSAIMSVCLRRLNGRRTDLILEKAICSLSALIVKRALLEENLGRSVVTSPRNRSISTSPKIDR